jgi:hypothetical protein
MLLGERRVAPFTRCHARESGHPLVATRSIKVAIVPSTKPGGYWIIRFRG